MPNSSSNPTTARPIRRISSWKVFGIFCLIAFTILVGVAFIPWDASMPEAPDLKYTPPIIPDAENAFTYIRAAGQLSNTKFKILQAEDLDLVFLGRIDAEHESWDTKLVDEILVANTTAFAKLDKGLACQSYISPKLTDMNLSMPWLSEVIPLIKLLRLRSKQAQLSGDYEEATRVALQELRLGEMISQGNYGLMDWLIGNSCQVTALSRLGELAHDVKTPEPRLKEILAILDRWSPQNSIRGYRHAVQCEYEIYKSNPTIVQELASTSNESDIEFFLVRIPYFTKHQATLQLMVPFYRNIIAEADKPFSQVKPNYPGKCERPTGKIAQILFHLQSNSLGKLMVGELSKPHQNALSRKCQLQAHVAALRLQIALRLYDQKCGQLPDTLKALEPEFIKELPKDPYDGKPFRYSKTEKKVWAIGTDLKDDDGKMAEDAIMQERQGYDLVMPLGTREMKPNLVMPSPSESTRRHGHEVR